MDRSQIEIALQIIGQQGLDNLAKSTANYKALLEDLHQQYARGDIDADQWLARTAEMTAAANRQQEALDALKGKRGLDGQGLMGASYAAQDFISVLAGGGGLGQAINSVSNNVPALVRLLGMGAGLGGAFSIITALVGAGIPIIQKWWGAIDSEAADKAKKRLEEIKRQIEDANKAFEKLTHAPTDYEEQSVKATREFLGVRPNAAKLEEGLVASTGEKTALSELTPEERAQYDALGKDILAPGQMPVGKRAYEEAARRRDAAISARAKLVREGRTRHARGLMARMGEFTAAGDAARGEVFKRMGDSPELFPEGMAANFRGVGPEALKAGDEEFEAFDADEHAIGSTAYGARKKREREARERAAKERLAEAEEEFAEIDGPLERSNAQARSDRLARSRQAKHDAAEAKRQQAAAKREAAADARDERKHGTPLERQVAGQIGRQFTAATGGTMTPENALAAARRLIDENNRAQQQAAAAFMGAMSGVGQNTLMWQQMTRQLHRGMEQGPMPSGLQR